MKSINEQFEQFEDSILYLSGQEEREARLLFGNKLKRLINQNPSDPDLYHKLGLCFYGLGSWEVEDKRIIEVSFHRAILLDESSVFSKIFLIHFYFDVCEFNLCLTLLSHFFDSDLRGSNVPAWRLVKLSQIKLSCMIYLKRLTQEELEKKLVCILKKIDRLDSDGIIAAEPTELLKALAGNSSEYNLIQVEESLNKFQNLCEMSDCPVSTTDSHASD